MSESGTPEQRAVFFRAADCQREDTWKTTGLRGTGSHHFAVNGVFVPESWTYVRSTQAPAWGGPLYVLVHVMASLRGAHAIGIARRAIDELVALAGEKRPAGVQDVLRDLPRVQHAVARAEALVDSARLYLHDSVGNAWDALQRNGVVSPEGRARLRLAIAHAAHASLEAVESMYRLGGGTAIYAASPLDRCFRDINTAVADVIVSPSIFEAAGRVYLGLESGNPLV